MKFCSYCDNFLYIKVEEGNQLQYHCKNCGNVVESTEGQGSVCIVDNNYKDDAANYKQYITKHLKHDPTLPRVNNIPCPNTRCTKPAEASDEVIFVKYDVPNMKYLYHCVHCDNFWR